MEKAIHDPSDAVPPPPANVAAVSRTAKALMILAPLVIGGSVAGWGLFFGILVWKPVKEEHAVIPVVEDHRVKILNDRDFPLLPHLPDHPPHGTARAIDMEARHQLQVADDLLRDGSASRAMELYADLVRDKENYIPYDALAYRFVLAREVQGDFEKALVLYRDLVRMSEDPRIITASVLGQSRVLLRSGRLDAARLLLCRALSLPSVVECQDQTLVGEILHVMAQVDAQDILRGRSNDLLKDEICAFAEPAWSVDQVLDLVQRSKLAATAPVQEKAIVVHRMFENRPQDALISVSVKKQSIHAILELFRQALGVEIEWSDRVAASLEPISETLNLTNVSFASVLDLLSISHGLAWSHDQRIFRIQLDEELDTKERRAQRYARAERNLLTALNNFPTHRFAPYGHLALGNLYFLENNLEGAGTEFRQVTQKFPTSKINVEASFNLAKVLLKQQRDAEALAYFYRAVDTGTGHPLRATAYAYIGRMHLESGKVREAVRPLLRGLSAADGELVQPTLAVLLAQAYLFADNAHAANAVLMEYRQLLSRSPQKHLAALLASLARFRALRQAEDADEPGRSLVISVVPAAENPTFGRQAIILIGQAYSAIGMASEMASLFEKELAVDGTGFVADELRSKLAEHYQILGDYEKALEILTELEKSSDVDAVRKAFLRKAKLALVMGHTDACLQACYDLLDQPAVAEAYRRDALRLLGQLYAMHDDHEHAALCFAGMLPNGRPGLKRQPEEAAERPLEQTEQREQTPDEVAPSVSQTHDSHSIQESPL